jgi:hypothetical protein
MRVILKSHKNTHKIFPNEMRKGIINKLLYKYSTLSSNNFFSTIISIILNIGKRIKTIYFLGIITHLINIFYNIILIFIIIIKK